MSSFRCKACNAVLMIRNFDDNVGPEAKCPGIPMCVYSHIWRPLNIHAEGFTAPGTSIPLNEISTMMLSNATAGAGVVGGGVEPPPAKPETGVLELFPSGHCDVRAILQKALDRAEELSEVAVVGRFKPEVADEDAYLSTSHARPSEAHWDLSQAAQYILDNYS